MNGDSDIHGHALDVAVAKIQVTLEKMEEATALQAKEYERRLHDLNGEYQRDRTRQANYVSMDKYEDKIASMDTARITAVQAEKEAREAAMLRVDEKFNEYVKRWEQIQSEQAATIITLSQAAAEAKRIAQDQGRQAREEADRSARLAKDQADAVQRRQTRNITIMGIALAAIVGLANLLPVLIN